MFAGIPTKVEYDVPKYFEPFKDDCYELYSHRTLSPKFEGFQDQLYRSLSLGDGDKLSTVLDNKKVAENYL